MQGEFSLFWSIIVPAVMAAGSIIITYALYRHFAGKINDDS
jgi:hypothetical protein